MIDDGLRLFDEFERFDNSIGQYGESLWPYMNKSARPLFNNLRNLFEDWFSEFDTSFEKRKRICREFRMSDDQKHISAFFELYLYQLFKRQGFSIEVEPEWATNRPDFLLTNSNGQKILLEATCTYSKTLFGSEKKYEKEIMDYLNENVSSADFFVGIEIKRVSSDKPSYQKMGKYLQSEINKLNYEKELGRIENGLDFSRVTWAHGSWKLEFYFVPKRSIARNKLGVRPIALSSGGVFSHTGTKSIKSRIDNKYSRYGDDLEIPFVIALNAIDFVDTEDIKDALFGEESFVFNWETNETRYLRQMNGSWSGPAGYQKKRVSAVLIFRRLYPTNLVVAGDDAILWHHPQPNHPLSAEVINMNQWVPNYEKGEYELVSGGLPSEILKLDKNLFQ